MIERHLKKLRQRDAISAEEEQAVRGLVAQVIEQPADRVIVREGQELRESLLLLDGWLARVKDLPGGQRQITELHVAGDFADLHGFVLKRLDHDVVTITRVRIGVVPHERIREMTERLPHLTRIYWFMTNLDAAVHREAAVSLGRRPALARMAHLFCELWIRLDIVGLTQGDSFDFPLTQSELAEVLGLTAVHVNRTLQELRRMGLVELHSGRLRIIEWEALKSAALFDESYLFLERRQR